MWAHWGPQCVPMTGDWYARNMYMEDSPQYLHHVKNYGHPSKVGYKDIVKLWKAEKFDPEALIGRYKRAGAAEDFRFTAKGQTIYATCMPQPRASVTIKSLAGAKVQSVRLVAGGSLPFRQD